MLPLYPDIFFLLLQIAMAMFGMGMTWKIYKLINHHNFWWVMSLGFVGLIITSVIRLWIPYSTEWYGNVNVLYLPLFVNALFVVSVNRILAKTIAEHEHTVKVEKELGNTLKRLRTLTIGDSDSHGE